jgi:hypothetical protein
MPAVSTSYGNILSFSFPKEMGLNPNITVFPFSTASLSFYLFCFIALKTSLK